jgi:hypothetical protein
MKLDKEHKELVRRLKKYLLAHREELIKPAYRDMMRSSHPLGGLCYVASEVYYHWLGKHQGYHPMVGRLDDTFTHWWLEDDEGHVIDLVYGKDIWRRVVKGRRTSFLTQKPSRRARKVICDLLVEMLVETI